MEYIYIPLITWPIAFPPAWRGRAWAQSRACATPPRAGRTAARAQTILRIRDENFNMELPIPHIFPLYLQKRATQNYVLSQKHNWRARAKRVWIDYREAYKFFSSTIDSIRSFWNPYFSWFNENNKNTPNFQAF